jgi:hypothetical protein
MVTARHKRLNAAWVAYLDIFGFKDVVKNRKQQAIDRFFRQIDAKLGSHREVPRHQRDSMNTAYQFSDCIFIVQEAYPTPDERLQSLLVLIKDLQSIALESGLVFRGALAFGPVVLSPSGCYGTPVNEAAEMEAHLAVPLVVLPIRHLEDAHSYLIRRFGAEAGLSGDWRTLQVRTKTGRINAHVVAPSFRLFEGVAQAEIKKSLIRGPDYLADAWESALGTLNGLTADEAP